MSKAVANLMHEHETMLLALNVLETIIQRFEDSPEGYAEDISGLLLFFYEFADECHHKKEEGIFIPVMEKYGMARYNGPVGDIIKEHALGRKLIKEMMELLEHLNDETIPFEEAAETFISLIRNHITKEHTSLFPMAESRIPAADLDKVNDDFEDFEQKIVGKGHHEKLRKMIDEFEEKYML